MCAEGCCYASVMLDVAIDRELDYLVPEPIRSLVKPGSRVMAPLQGRQERGYVMALKESSPYGGGVKPLELLQEGEESLPQELFSLALWMADYYATPLRRVMRCIVPPAVRRGQKAQEQLFALACHPLTTLQEVADQLRAKSPAQAELLGWLCRRRPPLSLADWLQAAKASRSTVDLLVKKGLVKLVKQEVDRSLLLEQPFFPAPPHQLHSEQREALRHVEEQLRSATYGTYLLHGITGSGKTEVYLQAIEQALALGKSAIFMIPEIALTTQIVERLRGRFSEKICILHHRLSDGERRDSWHKMRRGEVRIAVGARSVVFSPLLHLGLIVIDEEHESSYKQADQMPCYHGRDVAVMRAYREGATVLLGSATPSLESYYNSQQGKYRLLTLKQRAEQAQLPSIQLVDMRWEREKGMTLFSQKLLDGIEERLKRGEQTILFLNRRGYHTVLLCQGCNQSVSCRHCDSPMTFHKGEQLLCCHLCGAALSPPPVRCPACGSPDTMKYRGYGTEKVENSLHAIFPKVRTLRMDGDTTRTKASHETLLRQFASGKADVLVGTQMIAKGLHFPEVTLVGVINGDSTLQLPDFRSTEVTFQLLTQVAGRAGRGSLAGEVIIQTCLTDHSVMAHALRQDYEAFYREELAARAHFGYPPHGVLVKFSCSSLEEQQCLNYCERLQKGLQRQLAPAHWVMAVVPCGHAKVKDRYRFQFVVRGRSTAPIVAAYRSMMAEQPAPRGLLCHVDVNPLSTFF